MEEVSASVARPCFRLSGKIINIHSIELIVETEFYAVELESNYYITNTHIVGMNF